MWKKKFFYVLNYLKTSKTVHKDNPWTHSPQKIEKAVLMTAAYFKVSTLIYALRLLSFTKKGVSGLKQKKWAAPLNSAYSN